MTITSILQISIILLLLTNLTMLTVQRISSLIRLVALQGLLLATFLLLLKHDGDLIHTLLMAGSIVAIKSIGFPWRLRVTMRSVASPDLVSSFRSYKLSILAGFIGLIFSFWLETHLTLTQSIYPPLFFPAALSTVFAGLILVVGRMKALSQVVGYLVAENGIFLLGMPLMVKGSTWFELSLLLDVFVAVFVMGIAINHISNTFDSIDVGRFCNLRD